MNAFKWISQNWMEYFPYVFASAVITFVWCIIRENLDMLPGKQEKAKAKAIKLGHVVSAYYVKSYINKSDYRSAEYRQKICVYNYECNGKKYKYQILSDYPPESIVLYYVRNPKNARPEGAMASKDRHWIVRFFVILAIIIIIMKFF